MAMRATAQLSQDELKKQAAWKAVDYVKSGMILGLGTGSTAAFAVDRIGDLLESGELKDIIGVPTSVRTFEQAKGAASAVRLASCSHQHDLLVERPRMQCRVSECTVTCTHRSQSLSSSSAAASCIKSFTSSSMLDDPDIHNTMPMTLKHLQMTLPPTAIECRCFAPDRARHPAGDAGRAARLGPRHRRSR